jgi:hypothetical protein
VVSGTSGASAGKPNAHWESERPKSVPHGPDLANDIPGGHPAIVVRISGPGGRSAGRRRVGDPPAATTWRHTTHSGTRCSRLSFRRNERFAFVVDAIEQDAATAEHVVCGFSDAGRWRAVPHTEDFATAKHFAPEAFAARSAKGATVIRFQVPASVAAGLERDVIGRFREAPFVDIFGGSGFERILTGPVQEFNQSIQDLVRLRVGR